MGDSPQDVYAKCLPSDHGYPLWLPEPSSTLPMSYRQDGLQIGDVGCVSPKGAFNVLFNICYGPNHALHRRPGFSYSFDPIPLDIDREVDVNCNADPLGCIITSYGVTQPDQTSARYFPIIRNAEEHDTDSRFHGELATTSSLLPLRKAQS